MAKMLKNVMGDPRAGGYLKKMLGCTVATRQ